MLELNRVRAAYVLFLAWICDGVAKLPLLVASTGVVSDRTKMGTYFSLKQP